MLALERAVGASRVCAIECIAGGGAHHNRIWVNRERFDQGGVEEEKEDYRVSLFFYVLLVPRNR